MRKISVEDAIKVAKSYLKENDGQMPLIVVAKNDGEQFNLLGKFGKNTPKRPTRERDDMLSFSGTMRTMCMVKGINEYHVIVRARLVLPTSGDPKTFVAEDSKQDVLIVLSVSKNAGKQSTMFEFEPDGSLKEFAKPKKAEQALEKVVGLFSQWLPEKEEELSYTQRNGIESYMEYIQYTPQVEKPEKTLEDIFGI